MSIISNEIGKRGERIAAKYLKKIGFKILETNHKQSHNEIDIIACDREFLLFVEVKTRSVSADPSQDCESAASAVTKQKQWRTICAAEAYMAQNKRFDRQPRMDIVEVYLEKETKKLLRINHIPNAYGKK